MGQHVVQLAGDAEPLLAGPPAGLLLPGTGRLLGPQPADPEAFAGGGQHQEPGAEADEGGPTRCVIVLEDDLGPQEGDVADAQPHPTDDPVAGEHDVEEGGDEAEEDRAPGVAEGHIGQRAGKAVA